MNNSNSQLVDYIMQARARDLSDGQIRDNLKMQGGWSPQDILEGFQTNNSESA